MLRKYNDLFGQIASIQALRDAVRRALLGKRRKPGATVSPSRPHIIALPTSAFALRGRWRAVLHGVTDGTMAQAFARNLRRNTSEAERRLWSAVRGKRLLVELDGAQHQDEEQFWYNYRRTKFLEARG